VSSTRRPLIALLVSLATLAVVAGGLAWLLEDPRPPRAASRAQRLYYAHCTSCHGVDGRGSWRAALFLIRPGDLTRGAEAPDQYIVDIIEHGGAPLGRPGMPAFGTVLSEDDIRLLVSYLRELRAARSGGG
jgi:mono/diheme cytochrome c family protein